MKRFLLFLFLGLLAFVTACGISVELNSEENNTENNIISTEHNVINESESEVYLTEEKSEEMTEQEPQYASIELKNGINLGCAMECYDDRRYDESWINEAYTYETLWGSSPITKADIDLIRDAGFTTVRIPVTYRNHVDENGKISESWLARIKEIVDFVTQDEMYCIINIHHDTGAGGLLYAEEDSYEEWSAIFVKVWEQIADYFAEYDQKLIFEGYNEILNRKLDWNNAGESAYKVANQLNQDFVDAVRKKGGQNATRFLLVNTYAASAEEDAVRNFSIPEDGENPHIIVGVHCYFGIKRIPEVMSRLNQYFLSKEIPVVVGEFGQENKNTDERLGYVQSYIQAAQQYGIPCLWWDDGGNFSSPQKVNNRAILDRKNVKWYFPEIVDILINESAAR